MIYIGADPPIIPLNFSEVFSSKPKLPDMTDWFLLKVVSKDLSWNNFPGPCPDQTIVSNGSGLLDMYGSYMLTHEQFLG